MVVRCDRCRYTFEAADEEAQPACRQCGGPTVAADAPRAVEEAGPTQKLSVVPPRER